MRAALFLTTLPAPRLYGLEIDRVLEYGGLAVAVAKAEVLITDTVFDVVRIPVKQCCVLRAAGMEKFALENGFECVDALNVADWFKRVLNVDVTRRARSAPVAMSEVTVSTGVRPGVDASKYKVMYEGLVSELRMSDNYKHLDPNDVKTYDVLLQAMRGTLRKADSVAEEMLSATSRLEHANAERLRLKTERDEITEGMEEVLSGLAQAITYGTEVLTVVSAIPAKVDYVEYSGTSVKAKAGLGLAIKLKSVLDAREMRAVGSIVQEYVSCLAAIAQELCVIGTGAVAGTVEAQTAAHAANIARANAERSAGQLSALLEQEKRNIANYKQQVVTLNAQYQSQVQRVAELENQLLLSGGTSVPALQEQIRTLRADLQLKQEQIIRMEDIANAATEETVGDGVFSSQVATGIIRQLRTQVASLKLERDRAIAELMKAKQAATKESERAETLTNSARSLTQVALRGAQVSALPLFNYAAKALLIPVIGNGSAGVSSAAVSLAKMLGINSRTVLIDFDLVTTDMEGRLGERINPLVTLEGETSTSGKNSAMGLFIDRGKDFFSSHYSELAVRIDSNKAGILDYLPGFYTKPDLFMLTQADYTTLLNYLGARYDYIIIDAGKIGCSEIGDQILRNFCFCAFRTLLITDSSVEKTRAMRLKLTDVFGSELRRVIERSVWMVNRALTREDLSRFTAPAMSVQVPILPEMVGAHESFHITNGAQREFNKVVRALAGV